MAIKKVVATKTKKAAALPLKKKEVKKVAPAKKVVNAVKKGK